MILPEVRTRLRVLSQQLDDVNKIIAAASAEVAVLAEEITRRRSKRTPNRSQKITPLLRAKIKVFAAAYPNWSQQRIATRFNVNAGRVSEVLRGKRK